MFALVLHAKDSHIPPVRNTVAPDVKAFDTLAILWHADACFTKLLDG